MNLRERIEIGWAKFCGEIIKVTPAMFSESRRFERQRDHAINIRAGKKMLHARTAQLPPQYERARAHLAAIVDAEGNIPKNKYTRVRAAELLSLVEYLQDTRHIPISSLVGREHQTTSTHVGCLSVNLLHKDPIHFRLHVGMDSRHPSFDRFDQIVAERLTSLGIPTNFTTYRK